MIDIEDQLTAGMHDRVAGLALTRDVVGEAAKRHRHRTVMRFGTYAAAAIGLAGVLTAAMVVGTGPAPAATGTKVDAAGLAKADTAYLELVAAISSTQNMSYAISDTYGSKGDAEGIYTVRLEGAFDPTTTSGYLHSPQEDGDQPGCGQRLIHGVLFVCETTDSGDSWVKQPGKFKNLDYLGALPGDVAATADPDQLLQALRQNKAKVTKMGANKYHFTFTTKQVMKKAGAQRTVENTFVGDVTLNAAKQVAQVIYEVVERVQDSGRAPSIHVSENTLRFSNYGMQVVVEAP